MIHQHPLAYLLGLEGVALLRAFAGQHDQEFVTARLAEIRELLDRADELGDGGAADPLTAVEVYRSWAANYDLPGNQLLDRSNGGFPDLDESRDGETGKNRSACEP